MQRNTENVVIRFRSGNFLKICYQREKEQKIEEIHCDLAFEGVNYFRIYRM